MKHNHVHHDDQQHGHHHHGDLKGRKLGIAIVLNVVITLAQIVGGLISGSLALLSDALHNFSDVIALVISYLADKLASREFSNDKTFGYKRAEIMAAMINAVSLLLIGAYLVKEAVVRLFHPEPIGSAWVISLALLSIILNTASVLLLKDEAAENLNIRSAYLHLFTDVFTSVAVLAGGLAIRYFGLIWIDSLLSILIAIYLIYAAFGILMETMRVVMQFAPAGINLDEIDSTLNEIPMVANIHDVHLWQLNDKSIHFEAHVDFCEDVLLSQVNGVLQEIQATLVERFKITHTVLQPEIGSCVDSKLLCASSRKR
jgi:cobalt-zinc-cadmium efflux system protein